MSDWRSQQPKNAHGYRQESQEKPGFFTQRTRKEQSRKTEIFRQYPLHSSLPSTPVSKGQAESLGTFSCNEAPLPLPLGGVRGGLVIHSGLSPLIDHVSSWEEGWKQLGPGTLEALAGRGLVPHAHSVRWRTPAHRRARLACSSRPWLPSGCSLWQGELRPDSTHLTGIPWDKAG